MQHDLAKEHDMSRAITVSIDVYAAIWANRQDGEESEDQILRRVLGCKPVTEAAENTVTASATGGVFDSRNNVHFGRGFVAFRTYKHAEYEAVAQDGTWLRKDTGDLYATLNQLNASIVAGAENIWNGNWKYKEGGKIRSIDALRR
jgi:hypothetical protein